MTEHGALRWVEDAVRDSNGRFGASLSFVGGRWTVVLRDVLDPARSVAAEDDNLCRALVELRRLFEEGKAKP